MTKKEKQRIMAAAQAVHGPVLSWREMLTSPEGRAALRLWAEATPYVGDGVAVLREVDKIEAMNPPATHKP